MALTQLYDPLSSNWQVGVSLQALEPATGRTREVAKSKLVFPQWGKGVPQVRDDT